METGAQPSALRQPEPQKRSQEKAPPKRPAGSRQPEARAEAGLPTSSIIWSSLSLRQKTFIWGSSPPTSWVDVMVERDDVQNELSTPVLSASELPNKWQVLLLIVNLYLRLLLLILGHY